MNLNKIKSRSQKGKQASTMLKRLLLALFTLFCVCEGIGGRKELGKYWRSVMKDEDMPDSIKGLILEDGEKKLQRGFDKVFQARPNLIIYNTSLEYLDNHHHHEQHVKHQEVKKIENGV